MFYDSSVSTIYENGHKISMMSLAVPKFFEMVLIQLLGTMNTVMLSGYSQEAVAATSVANQIFERSLNANGDVRTTFIAPLITCWLFGVLLAYILGIKCGLGLMGCWIAFAVDEIVKCLIYAVRWKSDKWKEARI